jgi:arabinose-5-phosphate isomerase
MIKNPSTISQEARAVEALEKMNEKKLINLLLLMPIK